MWDGGKAETYISQSSLSYYAGHKLYFQGRNTTHRCGAGMRRSKVVARLGGHGSEDPTKYAPTSFKATSPRAPAASELPPRPLPQPEAGPRKIGPDLTRKESRFHYFIAHTEEKLKQLEFSIENVSKLVPYLWKILY
jgi:hypothetical protein